MPIAPEVRELLERMEQEPPLEGNGPVIFTIEKSGAWIRCLLTTGQIEAGRVDMDADQALAFGLAWIRMASSLIDEQKDRTAPEAKPQRARPLCQHGELAHQVQQMASAPVCTSVTVGDDGVKISASAGGIEIAGESANDAVSRLHDALTTQPTETTAAVAPAPTPTPALEITYDVTPVSTKKKTKTKK